MTWPLAFFYVFSVLSGLVFLFLVIVYLKEYSREEKLLKQIHKKHEDYAQQMTAYFMGIPAAPPKSPKAPKASELKNSKTEKKKDDLN